MLSCSICLVGNPLFSALNFVLKQRGMKDTVQKRKKEKYDKLTTWRGSDAEVSCEVIFERIENSGHVLLHFIQTDDVFHQR